MQLSDFFSANVQSLIGSRSIIVFKGDNEYPLLFFMQLLVSLRRQCARTIERIDLSELDLSTVQLKLETSFLGMSSIFFLSSIEGLDEKRKKSLISYFATYTGPNTILVYMPVDEMSNLLENATHVIVPATVDQYQLTQIMQWFESKPSQAGAAMITRLFKRYSRINLERACLVMQYSRLVSAGSTDKLDALIDEIIGSEQSLFTLSTYFFAQQKEQFFALWQKMHDQYADVFWITFWSEIVWRALYYVRYAKERNMIDAKKIAYRLPFSFMQRDWKLHDEQKLVAAHTFLYEADYQLKNGNEAPMIELFYSKFFENEF